MKILNDTVNGSSKTKLAICIPCTDLVQSSFMYCLSQLLLYNNSINLASTIFIQTGSLISRQRQVLAQNAIASGATHILWLDSDMNFPPNIAEVLLSHTCDIVACNYSTRAMPLKSVAYKKFGDWETYLLPNNQYPRLQEVDCVGMGCMLTNVNVFHQLELPWFEVSWVENCNDFIGEDFYFCILARQSGFNVMIDTVLSTLITHVGVAQFTLNKIG